MFAPDKNWTPDVAIFDFSCSYNAEHSSRFLERKGYPLLMAVVGDSLREPFWPEGTGCAWGFLAVLDTAWMIKNYAINPGQNTLKVVAERERLYGLLSSCKPDAMLLNVSAYTMDPKTRYRASFGSAHPKQVPKKLLNLLITEHNIWGQDPKAGEGKSLGIIGATRAWDKVKAALKISVKQTPKVQFSESKLKHDEIAQTLAWAQTAVQPLLLKVENLGFCLDDGKILMAMLHRYGHEQFNFSAVRKMRDDQIKSLVLQVLNQKYSIQGPTLPWDTSSPDFQPTMLKVLQNLHQALKYSLPVFDHCDIIPAAIAEPKPEGASGKCPEAKRRLDFKEDVTVETLETLIESKTLKVTERCNSSKGTEGNSKESEKVLHSLEPMRSLISIIHRPNEGSEKTEKCNRMCKYLDSIIAKCNEKGTKPRVKNQIIKRAVAALEDQDTRVEVMATLHMMGYSDVPEPTKSAAAKNLKSDISHSIFIDTSASAAQKTGNGMKVTSPVGHPLSPPLTPTSAVKISPTSSVQHTVSEAPLGPHESLRRKWCHFCGTPGVNLVKRNRINMHETCFRCQYCSKQLEDGSYEFQRSKDCPAGAFFCKDHANLPMEAKKEQMSAIQKVQKRAAVTPPKDPGRQPDGGTPSLSVIPDGAPPTPPKTPIPPRPAPRRSKQIDTESLSGSLAVPKTTDEIAPANILVDTKCDEPTPPPLAPTVKADELQIGSSTDPEEALNPENVAIRTSDEHESAVSIQGPPKISGTNTVCKTPDKPPAADAETQVTSSESDSEDYSSSDDSDSSESEGSESSDSDDEDSTSEDDEKKSRDKTVPKKSDEAVKKTPASTSGLMLKIFQVLKAGAEVSYAVAAPVASVVASGVVAGVTSGIQAAVKYGTSSPGGKPRAQSVGTDYETSEAECDDLNDREIREVYACLEQGEALGQTKALELATRWKTANFMKKERAASDYESESYSESESESGSESGDDEDESEGDESEGDSGSSGSEDGTSSGSDDDDSSDYSDSSSDIKAFREFAYFSGGTCSIYFAY